MTNEQVAIVLKSIKLHIDHVIKREVGCNFQYDDHEFYYNWIGNGNIPHALFHDFRDKTKWAKIKKKQTHIELENISDMISEHIDILLR